MILQLISLVNFKNHELLKVNFSKTINCFLGNNGVGKTNLLDAIYYLSFCKSYFNSTENHNIHYGSNYFMIKGDYVNQQKVHNQVDCSLTEGRKQFKFNGKKYSKLSHHIGKIPLVIITPFDANIILGGSEERRRFFDKLLSQLDNNYLLNLISYNRILRQRNTLLKDASLKSINEDLLLSYDNALHEFGSKIYAKRKECLGLLINSFQNYYDIISEKNEKVNIHYKSELQNNYLNDILIQNRTKDKILMYTSSGVHRDDFIFTINSHNLKKNGSQGQQKTFLISLKFAYFDVLNKHHQSCPILLLDDIFDKLDHDRVSQIIKILNTNQFGQIFITDTNFERISSIMNQLNSNCKYFMFNKNGLYEETFKSEKN